MESFEEYLTKKNIDSTQFKSAESARYAEWSQLFEAMHPESFTAQKKFMINDIRRRYQLKKQVE